MVPGDGVVNLHSADWLDDCYEEDNHYLQTNYIMYLLTFARVLAHLRPLRKSALPY